MRKHAALTKALRMENNHNTIYRLTRLVENAHQNDGPSLSPFW